MYNSRKMAQTTLSELYLARDEIDAEITKRRSQLLKRFTDFVRKQNTMADDWKADWSTNQLKGQVVLAHNSEKPIFWSKSVYANQDQPYNYYFNPDPKFQIFKKIKEEFFDEELYFILTGDIYENAW